MAADDTISVRPYTASKPSCELGCYCGSSSCLPDQALPERHYKKYEKPLLRRTRSQQNDETCHIIYQDIPGTKEPYPMLDYLHPRCSILDEGWRSSTK